MPAAVAGTDFTTIPAWATSAEDAGFSSLAVLDRIAYRNADPLLCLAAAAGATSRIGLTTAVLLAPLRHKGALLAKQAATLNALSGGRFTLGLGVGGRADDFEAAGVEQSKRGRIMDQMLEEADAVWRGDTPIGPVSRPRVLLGGTAPAAFARAAKWGEGWVSGGGGPVMFAANAEQARKAWADAGREGEPRLVALHYFALGDDAEQIARSYILDYYAFLGPFAERVADGAATDPGRIKGVVRAFEDAGCDELLLYPCRGDVAQVALLAEALR
ncbi:MAG TPA: LLM class flavin-dependent oxidoreductase [Acidimicrobiales bacterium]|nr:LLM class flavin-dependent oxidoreductase [Acidimicrobiales bacterium]